MTFFNQIINKIFSPDHQGENLVVINEILKRSEKDIQLYQLWLKEEKDILKAINKAYYYKKAHIQSDIKIHLFESDSANGFAITYNSSFGEKNFQHLLDFFRDKTISLNYKLQSSEIRMRDKKEFVEIRERYYLKPDIRQQAMEEKTVNQLYGNILFELIKIDNKPLYMKVLATHYMDSNFTQVLDYDDFIELLLND